MASPQTTNDYFKFCPGEEIIKISNAICRGRRRTNFPKCRGCQFNDDELTTPAVTITQERAKTVSVVETVFRQNDIAGAVPLPLSGEAAWRIGFATAQYVHGKLRGFERAEPHARSIILGRDGRPESEMLEQSLIDGILASGMAVLHIGVVDTPAIFFAVNHINACGGIVITGGSEPGGHSGFFLCGPKATPITADTGLSGIRDLSMRIPRHATGTVALQSVLNIERAYIDFLLSHLHGASALARPLRIVIDASNGVAGKWLPQIFERIGQLDLVFINANMDAPFSHHPDPTLPTALTALKRAVKEHHADFGICFSPDAVQCTIVDDKAQAIAHDLTATLLARSYIERRPGASIVFEHRFSSVAFEEIERAGGVAIKERVGISHTRKRMVDSNAVMGADLTGRYYFQENSHCESGFLALIHVINLLTSSGQQLSDLVRPLQRSKTSGELRFRCADVSKAIKEIAVAHAGAQMDELDGLTVRYADWWFNVRGGDRQPLSLTLEARNRKLVDQRVAELEPLLGIRIGAEGRPFVATKVTKSGVRL